MISADKYTKNNGHTNNNTAFFDSFFNRMPERIPLYVLKKHIENLE